MICLSCALRRSRNQPAESCSCGSEKKPFQKIAEIRKALEVEIAAQTVEPIIPARPRNHESAAARRERRLRQKREYSKRYYASKIDRFARDFSSVNVENPAKGRNCHIGG